MPPDHSRPAQRRRPALSVNTSASVPPLTPSRRPPVSRGSQAQAQPFAPTVLPSSQPRPKPKHASSRAAAAAESGTSLPDQHGRDLLALHSPISMAARDNGRSMADLPPIPGLRDSHDLSLPSRHVRDSLVSNMLLSLDQFSMGQLADPSASRTVNSFDDHCLYSLATSATGEDLARINTIPPSVSRGPARHGYSYSSDYEVPDDASRVSGSIHSRGHRSNSSSGFQSSLGRINSMRESLHRSSQPGTPRMLHSRGGKASKSSSTNSLDTGGYAQVLGSQRWAHGFGRRSSSFDMGQQQPPRNGQANVPATAAAAAAAANASAPDSPMAGTGQQPWHIEFSNSFFNNENYDDAAPTPTVPGGPRKLTSVPSMPSIPSYQPPPTDPSSDPRTGLRGPERRRSVRSSRSATVGRQPPVNFAAAAPPVPVFDLDSAPAPHVGYEKSKDIAPAAAPAQQQSQPHQPHQQHHPNQQHQHHPPHQKERQGFFRRVFGTLRDTVSSDSTSSSAATASTNHAPIAVDAIGNRAHPVKAQSTPPSRDSHHSTHAAIQKKPSGFFRRRKKSFSEVEAPPPLPVAYVQSTPPPQQPTPPRLPSKTQPAIPPAPPLKTFAVRDGLLDSQAAASPVTSLRRAMSPYLKGSPSFPNGFSANPGGTPKAGNPLVLQTEEFYDAEQVLTASPVADTDDLAARAVRGFSPDYEPSPDATIRPVDPSATTDGEDDQDVDHEHGHSQPHRLDTPSGDAGAPPSHPARSGSFLSDNSDSEDSPRRVATKTLAEHRVKQRASRSSLARSILGESSLLSPTTLHGRNGGRGSAKASDDEAEKLSLPIEGPGASPSSSVRPADGTVRRIPSLVLEPAPKLSAKATQKSPEKPMPAPDGLDQLIDEPEFVIGEPTEDDRNKALNIFEGNEDFIQREKAAAWMGEEGPVRQRTLQAYMDLHNFQNQSIVSALRDVCKRLILRAETQQVDRILVCFSKRWCACNPNHGFKSLDVVHTACYSIMLLNTDLHMADIEYKMTRSQFIKNTMTSIRQTVAECAPELSKRPSILPGRSSAFFEHNHGAGLGLSASALLPPRSGSSLGQHTDDCGPLVKAPYDGPLHGWEGQMEIVLKEIYASIREERLPLFGADSHSTLVPQTSQNNLSVIGMLKRTPSVLSKTPSEGQNSTRGRVPDQNVRAGSSRWTSKSRSRARGPTGGPGNGFSSSRTSFEDANSVWSPTVSSATWSRQSLGRTQASMSMESFGSSWRGDYQQSIGFANALSQAIIREDGVGDDQSLANDENPLLEDESLELAGPPWIKEGLLVHKHHVGSTDKKAKDRNWIEVFAVVQKGQMSLFSFTPNKSMRNKNRGRSNGALAKGAVVGGGNWQENATNLGTYALKQTLASILPPPGYSRQRQNVWALSLPGGGVHLFQVGTPEICKEFVTTVNYWSARLSTHPLVGGISNIEYGWSDGIVNNSLVHAIQNESSTALSHAPPSSGTGAAAISRPESAAAGRASMQSRSSFRSGSFDFGHTRSGSASSFGANGAAAIHGAVTGNRPGKLPGDRIHIADWVPPAQSLRGSNAAESQQLQILLAYVKSIEEELQEHNALRSPMLLAFTPRGHNAQKAMANWERRSAFLLQEIVKYRTYVDCLLEAERRRGEIYHERNIARRAARGEESDPTDEEDLASDVDDALDDEAIEVDEAETDRTLRQ